VKVLQAADSLLDNNLRFGLLEVFFSVLGKLWEWSLFLLRYNLLEVPGHHKPHKFYSDIVDFYIHWYHF